MHITEVLRRWLIVAAQIVGFAGTLYEAFWNGGHNPYLLKIFIELLLGAGSASIPWRSLLQGFHFRFEIREPKTITPTLLIDISNLNKVIPPSQPLESSSMEGSGSFKVPTEPRQQSLPLQPPLSRLDETLPESQEPWL